MVIPLRISIVDHGANGYPFEVFDANTYINKNASETMTTENTNNIEDAKFSIKEFLGLKKIFNETVINKAEDETPTETPAETAATDGEDKVQELFDKLDLILKNQEEILAQINKAEEEEPATDDEEINKADDEETETSTEEEEEEETEINKETDINKSVTDKPADIPQTHTETGNFFKRTNRDALGRKIRR